jgi:hypothetical protein
MTAGLGTPVAGGAMAHPRSLPHRLVPLWVDFAGALREHALMRVPEFNFV